MTVHVTTVCRSPVWTRTRVYSNLTYQICKQQSFMDSEGEKRLISTFQAQQTCRYTLVILTGILNTSFVSTYTLACKFCFSGYSFTFTGNGATRHYSFANAASRGNYILLRLSNLACKSASIPLSAFPALSAWATFPAEAGWATAADGAPTSCK